MTNANRKPETQEPPTQCERCTEQIATLRLTLVTFQGDLLDMEKVCRQCARDVGMIP